MNATALQNDAESILAGFSASELRQRLNHLEAEAKAVKVLLRAAVARERLLDRRAPRQEATSV